MRGKWIRVERDLLRGAGAYYQYLFYRRLPPSSSLPTVREVKLLTPDEANEPGMRANLTQGGWTMVEHDLHSGIWPGIGALHLWYRTEPQSSRTGLAPFTEFEATYGLAGPRFGFEKVDHVVQVEGKPEIFLLGRRDIIRACRESVGRSDAAALPKTPPLLFDRQGNFTILQIADLYVRAL